MKKVFLTCSCNILLMIEDIYKEFFFTNRCESETDRKDAVVGECMWKKREKMWFLRGIFTDVSGTNHVRTTKNKPNNEHKNQRRTGTVCVQFTSDLCVNY